MDAFLFFSGVSLIVFAAYVGPGFSDYLRNKKPPSKDKGL